MKIFSFVFLVQFVLFPLLIVPTIGSAESTEQDVTSVPDVPRVLKKAKGTAKEPKSGGKVSKSAKGSVTESPSSPPTTSKPSAQPSSPPTDDPCVVEGISNQNDALLALKAGFDNGDDILGSWVSTTDPCSGDASNWGDKITCSSGKVTEIYLDEVDLTGTISPLIGCPTGLVSSLTGLYLGINSLNGTIPTELGGLTSLAYVDFADNILTGSIPTELGELKSLTGLYLNENSLTGSIPTELGLLKSLEKLYLDDTSLGPGVTMPAEICALRDNATPAGLLDTLKADCNDEVSCSCCTNTCV